MKEKLRELYKGQSISASGLLNAVGKGWINVDDVVDIVGEDCAMEVLLTAKLSELSSACGSAITAGVDVEIGDRVDHFNLSLEDQSNINNLFRVVELGGTEFPYQADDGQCTVYTAIEIANIYIQAQSLITMQTAYHNAVKTYTKSLETAEEISAVTYGMELPEPYAEELQHKLEIAAAQMGAILMKVGAGNEATA